MLKEINCTRIYSEDDDPNYQAEIIDDNFTEIIKINTFSSISAYSEAVIQVYEKRNLNVAVNLFKLLQIKKSMDYLIIERGFERVKDFPKYFNKIKIWI